MRPEEVERLLERVRDGDITIEEALGSLRDLPVPELDFAQIDTHRELRQGFPEVIYAEGKTSEQVIAIAEQMLERTGGTVFATRVPERTAQDLTGRFPEAVHHASARLVVLRRDLEAHLNGLVAVVTAGTSDLPVADEVAVTAETLGCKVERVNDVGVAGFHRVLGIQDRLRSADVVIVIAGMEGALASVVGGMSPAPVVAVPTSVGYGASFQGLAALLAMLNSCAAGIAVMNIDNGFGAAMFAARILRNRQGTGDAR